MSEFTDELVEQAWARAGGVCECECATHGHLGRCGKALLKPYRDDRYSFFGWEAHSKSGRYMDSLSDCEILCWDPCHISTLKSS